jgi:hypothetical protein
MEMMDMVNKVVTALKGDKSLLSAFTGDPVKIVTSILGSGISGDLIGKIIQEVTKQLGPLLGSDALKGVADAAVKIAQDAAGKKAQDAAGGGVLGKIKNLF